MNKYSPHKNFVSLAEFIEFCKTNNIKSSRAFMRLKNRPLNIPSAPRATYKSEWTGWCVITGNKNIGLNKNFRSFDKFVDFCQRHNIKTSQKFYNLVRPIDIPSNPNLTYKKEWKGWAYITNSGGKNRWLPFKEARTYMHTQNLTGRTGERGWIKWAMNGNRPHNIPSNPYTIYGKKWTTWRDFLGTNWLKYPKSKIYAIASQIRVRRDWSKKGMAKYGIEKPGSIPLVIKNAYPEDWEGIKNFLGTKVAPYNEFIDFLIENNIRKSDDLNAYLKANPQKGIKNRPDYNYPNQWPGWLEFKKSLRWDRFRSSI